MRKRRRKYTDEQLAAAIQESVAWAEVLDRIGLKRGGGSMESVRRYADELGLNYDHFTGSAWDRSKVEWTHPLKKSLNDILVENSDYTHSSNLRKRLIKEGLLDALCYECGITEWLYQPAPLQLDHINGENTDNRLENLRLLCPNCHALTETFAGRNKRGTGASGYRPNFCPCGKQIHSRSRACLECFREQRWEGYGVQD